MRKTQILMNKPFCLGLPILDLSKTVMLEFWYDYMKPKYGVNTILCYMVQTASCKNRSYLQRRHRRCWKKIWHFKFWNRPLPKGKNKKVIGLIKDELGGQIMKEFVGLKEKHIAILKTTTMKVKKQKAQKVCQNFKILKTV